MFRIFLRIVLAVLLVRFLGGILRAVAGGSQRESGQQINPRPQPPRSLVDRASAIDVPFTEERQEG